MLTRFRTVAAYAVLAALFCLSVPGFDSFAHASTELRTIDGHVVRFPHSRAYIDFIRAEQSNDYIPEGEVNPAYQPQAGYVFEVPYIEIPESRIVLEKSNSHNQISEPHLYGRRQNGERYVRFFIHPESRSLYQPLIDEFGIRGHYLALATASTRTVLAWDPRRPSLKPIFIKLSLAKIQSRLGRIVPGWEIRRSVRLTETAAETPQAEWTASGAEIIPEVAGVHILTREGLSFYIDEDQGQVFEHGFILRDASFIESHPGKIVVPLFSLFTKVNGNPPMIISLWQQSGIESFYEFLQQYLVDPMIEKSVYLNLIHGIAPQIHGQNVLVVLDRQTKRIEKFLHRDVGSMKTDYRLRWIHGLSIRRLMSSLSDKDFGLSWAYPKIEEYFVNYFIQWPFRYSYAQNIRAFVPDFSWEEVQSRGVRALRARVARKLFPNAGPSPLGTDETTTNIIGRYVDLHIPPQASFSNRIPVTSELRQWVDERRGLNQVVQQGQGFPTSWAQSLNLTDGEAIVTDYGMIMKNQQNVEFVFYERTGQAQEFLSQNFSGAQCRGTFAGASGF